MRERRLICSSPARRSSLKSVARPVASSGLEEVVCQMKNLGAPAARLDHPLHTLIVKDRRYAIPAAREQAGQRRHKFREHPFLGAVGPAEAHRGRPVEQEPDGQLPIFHILADEGGVHARGHIPVYVPDVVARLVLAQIGKIQPGPIKERAVVALQQAIQSSDHLPLEAQQKRLRGGGGAGRLHGPWGGNVPAGAPEEGEWPPEAASRHRRH